MTVHPCSKEVAISTIEVTVENIEKCLTEQRDILKEFVVIMQRIAQQNEQIVALKDTDIRHDKQFDNLFPRVGKLEVEAEGGRVRIGFIMAGMATASSLLTGLLMKFWRIT